MDGYDAQTYGDRFADVYDEWYDGITDADACASMVVALARSARSTRSGTPTVVELGVGTGRLAIPIAAQGTRVIGIDASRPMLDRAAAKASTAGVELDLVEADLGRLGGDHFDGRLTGEVDVALLAFNTLFNLTTEAAQVACLTAVASWLTPGGVVIVEAFVPADDLATTGRTLEPRHIAADEVVLTVSEVGSDGRTISGQHIHIRDSGTKLRAWELRMIRPDEIDDLATRAGLRLRDRAAGWTDEPFDDDSLMHVSRYERS